MQFTTKEITGSIQEKNNTYYAVLGLYDKKGIRKPKWLSTGYGFCDENFDKAETLKNNYIDFIVSNGNLLNSLSEKQLRNKFKEVKQSFDIELAKLEKGKKYLFSDYMFDWLSDEIQSQSIEETTAQNLSNEIKNHLAPYFEDKGLTLQELKPRHFKDYYSYKSTSGRLDGKKGGLAYETIKKQAGILKRILNEAVTMDEIFKNPAENIKVTRTIEDKEKEDLNDIVFLSQSEADDLLKVFESEQIKPIIIVCLYYGLRRSEVLGLRWQAIDFENNTMSIEHTVVKHNTIIAKDRTKNKKSKAIYELLPEIKELFLYLQLEQEKYKKEFKKDYIRNDYIFTWQNGRLFRPDSVTARFNTVARRNGYDGMTFHHLRHSCASILYEKGWKAKDIQEWLRHSRIETTMNIYTHISSERRKLLTKGLEDMF